MEGSVKFDQLHNSDNSVTKVEGKAFNSEQKKIFIELDKLEKEDLEYLKYLHNNPDISDYGLEFNQYHQAGLDKNKPRTENQVKEESDSYLDGQKYTNKQLLLDIIQSDGSLDGIVSDVMIMGKAIDHARPISWNTKEVFLRMYGKEYPEINLADIKKEILNSPTIVIKEDLINNKGETNPNVSKLKSIFNDPVYLAMSQDYIKGMTVEELSKTYLNKTGDYYNENVEDTLTKSGDGKKVAQQFLNDIYESRRIKKESLSKKNDEVQEGATSPDPAARLMTEILLQQPGLAAKGLEHKDWQAVTDKFIASVREVWQDFYYSGQWSFNRKTKEFEVLDNKDMDAKVSLFLFKLAGIKGVALAKSLPPGSASATGTTVDSGKIGGVVVNKDKVVIDNHQPSRGYETSSAKILYRLLASLGKIKENGHLRALVELSVDDDNGRLITNQEQFDSSNKTLRGLHRYIAAEELFTYIRSIWHVYDVKVGQDETDRGKKIYDLILNHELSEEDIKNLDIQKGFENQTNTIKRAHEWLIDVPTEKLLAEGKMVRTKYGLAVAHIEEASRKKLYGGHDAVAADGRAKIFISYDPDNQSILINTLDKKVDISVAFNDFIKKHQELIPVRGVLLIKPRDGQDLSFDFEELMSELEVQADDFKGQILTEIEKERIIKAQTDRIKQALETHKTEILGLINNLHNKIDNL